MWAVELIKKKRDGFELTPDELKYFISDYLNNRISEYQMSSLLMAIFFKGMSESETLALTLAMLNSGETVSFDDRSLFYVDKHSTGGIGDKTSLILAPVVSALGIPVPMISGRGLGHTGGTLDKLESIPGFNTQLSIPEFKSMIKDLKVSLIGQTPTICPADKRIYALRDVTGTVESLPLICASIMSKKFAEGIDGLVLDVKFGDGAFMKSLSEATLLAKGLMNIAKGAGKKVTALLTNMNQPLGTFAGNSLEVQECLDILQNKVLFDKPFHSETRELSLALAAHMVMLANRCSYEAAYNECQKVLENGKAMEQFEKICIRQGGQIKKLPSPRNTVRVLSSEEGYLSKIHLEKIGWLNVKLGAGRKVLSDNILPTSGLEFHAKINSQLKKGDPLFTIYGDDLENLKAIEKTLRSTVEISSSPTLPAPLIQEVLT